MIIGFLGIHKFIEDHSGSIVMCSVKFKKLRTESKSGISLKIIEYNFLKHITMTHFLSILHPVFWDGFMMLWVSVQVKGIKTCYIGHIGKVYQWAASSDLRKEILTNVFVDHLWIILRLPKIIKIITIIIVQHYSNYKEK